MYLHWRYFDKAPVPEAVSHRPGPVAAVTLREYKGAPYGRVTLFEPIGSGSARLAKKRLKRKLAAYQARGLLK